MKLLEFYQGRSSLTPAQSTMRPPANKRTYTPHVPFTSLASCNVLLFSSEAPDAQGSCFKAVTTACLQLSV